MDFEYTIAVLVVIETKTEKLMFYGPVTSILAYQVDGRVIMKGCVQ